MQSVFGLENVAPDWQESTVSVGVFDGVHLGHQAVISAAVSDARSSSRPCVVLTFDKNPLAVVKPERCPQTVLSTDLKLMKIAALGVDVAVVCVFDEAFSQQSPSEFLDDVLKKRFRAKKVVVGHDFTFGKDRAGTPEWLSERIPTTVIPPLERAGRRVSSSEIRKDIVEGKMREAADLLGSAFALDGKVIAGNRLGRELGFPTANVEPIAELQVIPKLGIYAGIAEVGGKRYSAAISVGARPTIPGAGFAIEAYLLDYDGPDCYCERIVLDFLDRIRDEIRFDSTELLVGQMRRDIEQVRAMSEVRNA